MLIYIAKRILNTIPIIIGVIFLSFVFLKMAPGDFFSQLELNPQVSRETLNQLREQFGLDQNVFVQFSRWIWSTL